MLVALIVVGAVVVELLLAVGVGRFIASGNHHHAARECGGRCGDPVEPTSMTVPPAWPFEDLQPHDR